MQLRNILLCIISFLFTFSSVISLNILGIFPYTGKSHFFVFEPYLRELARRGHNLTVISYFPQQKPIENYHDISLAGKIKILQNVFPIDRSYWTVLQSYLFIYDMGIKNCEVMLSDERVQNLWLSKAKFDIVVTEQFNSDCSLGLAYKLGAPVVGITSHVLMPWHFERFGIHYNPSYMAFQSLEGGTKPTLYQRIERFIFHNVCCYLYKYISQRESQVELQQYFDTPSLYELSRNIKVMLVYTNFVINGPTLLPPNVIEVGGYHVAKPKELPADLKRFIEQSEHGIIYISFGTMVQAATIPTDKYLAIVGAISELPQRVVWKWDDNVLPGKPTNVYVSDWLPQNDILAHENVLAFFSHCGLLGTTEAVHHGVPIVGMPVFGDQPQNADAVEESGLGVTIQVNDLTKETLLQRLKTVLDPQFRRKVKELSKVWYDRPASAMDTAIYWTEFAARTKNYTFRSPASTVPLYQYLYLDIGFVFTCLCFVTITLFKCVKYLFTNVRKQSIKLKIK